MKIICQKKNEEEENGRIGGLGWVVSPAVVQHETFSSFNSDTD